MSSKSDTAASLGAATDQELFDELQRREEERKAARERKEADLRNALLRNIEGILELVPEHQRTSCSDTRIVNMFRARCARCVLLSIKSENWVPTDIKVTVEVTRKSDDDDDD